MFVFPPTVTTAQAIELINAICTAYNYALLSFQLKYISVYESKGVEGLTDRRGKAKPEDALTEADRLRMENKILQAKLKDMEMENKLLKKLRELQGGGH